MNKVEKEAYLREYSILKAQGKPFFPYAVAKDGAMALRGDARHHPPCPSTLGAELGPKADPTTTTYTPRPEWYFFFLFELRVIKPPSLVAPGDDRDPDDLHDPALPAAVLQAGARAAPGALGDAPQAAASRRLAGPKAPR